jgi:cell division protease FtsH
MVARYGMNTTLGQVSYDPDRQVFLPQNENFPNMPRSYSEQTAWQIDEAVRELSARAFALALDILRLHRALLDETALRLLEKETLSAEELPQIPAFFPPAITTLP